VDYFVQGKGEEQVIQYRADPHYRNSYFNIKIITSVIGRPAILNQQDA
jgi:hypothetical protein